MIKDIIKTLLLTFVIYLFFASVSYAFRHPEMTDTQRALHFKDMIMFK